MRKYIVAALLFVFSVSTAIAQQQCIITTPAAASSWVTGTNMPIQWNAGAFTSNVNISLIDYSIGPPSGTVVLSIATNVANTGNYNFLIPTILPARCTYGVYVQNSGPATQWCYGPSDICITNAAATPGCCPKFSLKQMGNIEPCQGDTTCKVPYQPPHGGNPLQTPSIQPITACKNSAQTYYVFPNLPGFTFAWTVVGGTLTSFTGNTAVITWGNGTQGLLQVIITDSSGNCRDTITRKVCLLNSPVAGFTVAPSTTVCANSTPITFTNTSVGANSYSWNFGDGTGSTLANPPPHIYTTPGTYTVLLTVSNGSGGGTAGGESRCGCTDTASVVITVLAGTGPTITSSCKKMLCPGDTATYCVSPGCAPYNWTVNGGTIISSSGNCITVQWNATPPAILPASVSVTTGCGGVCGNAATLNVPVLWNNMLISGPNPVCVGTASTYSLPVMPGTFYNWTVTGAGGGTITGPNQNTASINVFWSGPPGTATITCNYNNPYSGCSGTSTRTISVRNKFTATGPAVVCTGTAAAYNSNGPANWVISPVSGFTVGSLTNVSSINVNWTIPGVYTITSTGTNPANFCNNNAVINVVVNQTPILNLIVGPTSICPGSFYTYSVSSNLIGPFVWTTSAGGTVISQMGANNDSVIIQWTGTGPHSITVSQTVNGCKGLKTLSPINNVPAVSITGPASVCRDQTPNPQYTASGGLPAGSYTWSISPAAAGTITGGQGTNQINVLWSGGVAPGTSSATVNVVVCNYPAVNYPVTITTPANVTVTKTGSLCTMPGVTLSVSPSLPCYQWYLNGVAISGATSATYVATTHGYYEVKCPTQCSGYGGIFVPREYIPNVTISTTKRVFCTTEPISTTLFSAASGGCSYSWFRNNVLVAGPSAINTPLNVTTVGSYYQVVTCGNCKDTSNTIVVYTQVCGTTPGCDLSFNPSLFNGQQNMGGPAGIIEPVDKSLLAATLNINPPSSFCNNVQFSANMSFTSPHSLSSGIFWNFGDGGTFSTTASGVFTPPHTYTSVGIYVVTASINVDCPPPPTPNICPLTDTIHYVVPIAANFSSSVNCNKIYLTDLSTVLSPCTIATYSWSATGPGSVSFSNPAAASPLLTVGASGTYNVTLTVTSSCNGCVATITLPVIITLPSATFTVPSPVCAGTPVAFNAPAGMSNYLWNFGDGFTSSLQNTTHTFDLTPTNPTITLTVSNAFGCVATASNTITVNPPPALTVSALQMICPGQTATITTTVTGGSFNTFNFYQNGILVQSGALTTYTTGIAGTYYVIASTTGGGCVVKSALTYVFHYPNPVAKIMGSSVACLSGGSATIYLYNAVNNPTSTYSWNLQGNVTVLSTNYNLFTTVNAVGNYSYIITVTDSSGCIARDTLCVVVANSPVVTVVPSTSGAMCAGVIHSFIASATPPNPNYIYLWSNGVTGTTMSTTLAGNYSVTVTNPANGCSGFGFAGTINPRPSTILFPIGCDTLCPKDSIIPPLALGGPIVPGGYTVQWFLNGNYASPFFTGPVLNIQANMPPLIFGMNNISIVVTYNGCSDTSKAYNLFIESCDCDCEESHWGEIQLNEGDHPGAKTANVGNPTGGTPIILNCGVAQKLDCNKTYTINSTYFCKDSICSDSVTYSLQPPTGPAITGSIPAPLTFTVTQSGTYTLTMYGWCGDKICDSCVIKFVVDCKKCDCKGSKWDKITLTPGKPIYDDHEDNPASAKIGIPNPNTNLTPTPNPVNLGLNCGKTYKLDCNKPYTLNANYLCKDSACAGKVTFSLQPPTGLPITGTLPPGYTFTPTQSGVYTLTMYGWCDTVKCDSCIIYFEVKCSCDCSGSKWGEKYYTIDNVTKQINCNKEKPDEVKVKCNKPITVNANYNCVGVNCKSDVTYTLQPPIGLPTSGSLPITFTPSLPGTYTLTMYGWCDGKICDSCVVKFITDCVKDSSCCPYEIKIKQAPSIQTSVINNPAATVANGNFTFTGPTGNLFTEVRAQVVSYNLYSNFNNECLNCKSYPFSWASIYQPGLIGSMPPQITMFNAVTNAFNPAGAGMYQNPREVIWSSATPFALPSNINISFLLPPSSIIDCCELTAKICVKFTFRNNDCKECEVIVCFEVPIKKK